MKCLSYACRRERFCHFVGTRIVGFVGSWPWSARAFLTVGCVGSWLLLARAYLTLGQGIVGFVGSWPRSARAFLTVGCVGSWLLSARAYLTLGQGLVGFVGSWPRSARAFLTVGFVGSWLAWICLSTERMCAISKGCSVLVGESVSDFSFRIRHWDGLGGYVFHPRTKTRSICRWQAFSVSSPALGKSGREAN